MKKKKKKNVARTCEPAERERCAEEEREKDRGERTINDVSRCAK